MNSTLIADTPPLVEDYTLMKQVLDVFTKYLFVSLCIFGLLGNTITAVIGLQKNSRQISTCVYMTGLSIADSMVLIGSIWGMGLMFYASGPPPEILMRIAWYQAFAFGSLSGFYLAEMTIDRLVAVRFPMLTPRICTTKRARITVVTTFVVINGINLYIVFKYHFVTDEITGMSRMRLYVPEAPVFEILGNIFQLAVGTFLPFVIIVFCNLWIVFTLKSAARRGGKLGVKEEVQKARTKETTYLTRMLIFVSVAYVIASIPYRLYNVIFEEVKQNYDFSQEYWVLRQNLEHFVLGHFWNWNYAINFYLYCIGGGKKYRNEVKSILRKVFFCGR